MSNWNEEMEALDDLIESKSRDKMIKAIDMMWQFQSAIRQLEIADENKRLEKRYQDELKEVKKRIELSKARWAKHAKQLNLFNKER